MTVHVNAAVVAGTSEACEDFRASLVKKFPTKNNVEERPWYTGWLSSETGSYILYKHYLITQTLFAERR